MHPIPLAYLDVLYLIAMPLGRRRDRIAIAARTRSWLHTLSPAGPLDDKAAGHEALLLGSSGAKFRFLYPHVFMYVSTNASKRKNLRT